MAAALSAGQTTTFPYSLEYGGRRRIRMKRLKGIGLLLIANVLIFITLSISFNVLVNIVLPAFGIDVRGAIHQQDLLWALVIGFGGAFLSLAFSKQMARAMLDCRQIERPQTPAEHVIHGSVQEI